MNDMDLVREYARSKSEEAFASLVSRHVNLVYSVAFRQVRDRHLAEEVTQTVFVILARKADTLSSKTVVSGWLCQTARYAAAKALTTDWRRQNREHQAYMQSTLNDAESAEKWTEIEPVLDAAMGQLSRKDHDALVVRFFESRNFKDVGATLGTTEAGAKMRVNRALEKLRGLLGKRGITLSVGVLTAAVSANSIQAAPAGLAASATLAAIKGAAVTTSTFTLINSTLKYMAWTKMKTAAVVGGIALLTVGTATVAFQPSGPAAQPKTVAKATAPYETPEATLNTIIAALKVADHEKFAEACTPERAEVFRAQNAGKTDAEMKREAAGMAKALTSFKILEKKNVSPTEVILHIKPTGDTSDAQPGDVAGLRMRLRKIGNDWKFDGHAR
jgi:RNA polymerase sigma factor (sigma-70 family)